MVLSRPVLISSEPSYWSAVDEIKNSLVDWLLLNFCSSSPNQLGLENIKCSEHLHEIQSDPPPPFSPPSPPTLTPKHTQRFFIGSLQVANLLICTERLAYILQEHGLGFTIRTGVHCTGIALQNFAGVENISCAGTLLCSGHHTLFTQFQLHVTWHIECSYYFAKQKWQNYEKCFEYCGLVHRRHIKGSQGEWGQRQIKPTRHRPARLNRRGCSQTKAWPARQVRRGCNQTKPWPARH